MEKGRNPLRPCHLQFKEIRRGSIMSQTMTESITVHLPEDLARRARAVAALCNQPLEDAMVSWIDHAVMEPPVELLPDAQVLALCDLELDAKRQRDLSRLLSKNRDG